MAESSVFINPLTDFGFKYLFQHKELMLSFLNAVLNLGIVDFIYIDKENVGESPRDRASIYDLHCELADGSKIIVEMQNSSQINFKDRALYYVSQDFVSQGQKGDDWDYSLTPVYGIFLMNFNWKDEPAEHLREDVALYNKRTMELFSKKLSMVFLKVPLMTKDADECKETLDRWLYILKNMDKMESMPTSFLNEPVFKTLGRLAQVAALTPAQKRAYDHSLKVYRDNNAIAQAKYAEGKAEGKAEERAKTAQKLRAKGWSEEEIEDFLND